MIHEVVTHPVSGDPIHIDFYAVKMNEEVTASVPLHFTGTSDAVKLLGGILTIQHHQIEVRCLPKHLLADMEVSLEPLKTFHDLITVADVVFPEEITVIDNPHTVVASVAAPRLGGDDADSGGTAEAEAGEAKPEASAAA
jgi:large subunit ribosomal protein L25